MVIEVTTLHQFHVGVLAFKKAGYDWSIHPDMLWCVKKALKSGHTVILTNKYAFGEVTNKMLIGWE